MNPFKFLFRKNFLEWKDSKKSSFSLPKGSIEETHPSLKGKNHCVSHYEPAKQEYQELISEKGVVKIPLNREPDYFEGRTINPLSYCGRLYNEEDIQKYTRDVEEIKKAIEDVCVKYQEAGDNIHTATEWTPMFLLMELRKALRLEEE